MMQLVEQRGLAQGYRGFIVGGDGLGTRGHKSQIGGG
jgi:hypothetical protein